MEASVLPAELRTRASQAGLRVLPYDIRHQAEVGRRRWINVGVRRVLRLSSLYLLDGALIVLTVLLTSRMAGASPGSGVALLPFVVPLFLLALTAYGTYHGGAARIDMRRLLGGVVTGSALVLLQAMLVEAFEMRVLHVAALGSIAFLLLALERFAVNGVVQALRRRGHLYRRTLIVGGAADALDVMRHFRSMPHSDLFFVGHVLPEGPADSSALGTLDQLERVIERYDVRVVLLGPSGGPGFAETIVRRCFEVGVPVIAVASMVRRLSCKVRVFSFFETAALELEPPRLQLPQLALKRTVDIVLSGLALLLLSPLFLLIGLLVKLDSEGPVFFRQTRVGVGGKPFRIFKFRSMRMDAEDRRNELEHLNEYGNGRLFKMRDDPRITRVGRILRRTSLDELPQLLNVLMGDMSLVGPRPPIPQEVADYDVHHLERLTVLPGITGPWQVGGRNNVTDFERIVELEREYIRDWSLRLDVEILLRTIAVVARREGAH